ncbi:hypothetical protein SESBI_45446 [Sesbania bispinosa]|nr:hypothetical protein SESBI_45446 [Sesbania bispinosa]
MTEQILYFKRNNCTTENVGISVDHVNISAYHLSISATHLSIIDDHVSISVDHLSISTDHVGISAIPTDHEHLNRRCVRWECSFSASDGESVATKLTSTIEAICRDRVTTKVAVTTSCSSKCSASDEEDGGSVIPEVTSTTGAQLGTAESMAAEAASKVPQ